MIWFCRNSIAHGKECLAVDAAALVTKERVSRFWCTNFKFIIIGEEGRHLWDPPIDGAIKINCDGFWHRDTTRAGFDCIARDSAGLVVGIIAGYRMEEGAATFHARTWGSSGALEFMCI